MTKSYPQMSPAQRLYVTYVAQHPGCCIADVDRACRFNPRAGHKWVYDGVKRLIHKGVLRTEPQGARQCLYVVED